MLTLSANELIPFQIGQRQQALDFAQLRIVAANGMPGLFDGQYQDA